MTVETADQARSEFEVLSEEELAHVVGGVYETAQRASSIVMGKVGGCGCGVGH